MKIAYLSTVDIGIRFLVFNHLRALQAAGHQVHAICRDGPWVDEVRAAGITVHCVAFSRKFAPYDDVVAFQTLIRMFRQERFDLIHTHTPKASLLGQYAAWIARIPLRVHTVHGFYFPGFMRPHHRQFYIWLERITLWPAHRVLSVSQEDLQTAVIDNICHPDKIQYVGNGIDVQVFDPASVEPADVAQLRAELNLGPNTRVVGMVGRMVAEKGYLEFFTAARLITSHLPNTTFLCIGPDEPNKADAITPEQRTQAQQYADIRFLGMRRDLPQLYMLMDCVVLPSHREGLPYVPIEAAAMGRPMVLSNIRGCREVVDHNHHGILIPVKDAHALAAALTYLLHTPEVAHRYGTAARERALREFDEQIIIQRIFAVYNELRQEQLHAYPTT